MIIDTKKQQHALLVIRAKDSSVKK